MRRVSAAQKSHAQHEADRSLNLSLIAGFLGTAFGGAAALAAPPVGFTIGVAFSAWAAALNRHAIVLHRIVRDPPDPEYRSATNIGRPRFDLEPMRTDDDFSRSSATPIASLLQSSSIASAMVRALERSQGAAQDGEAVFEQARFAEARRYAGLFGEELGRFTESSDQVMLAVRRLPTPSQTLPRGGRLFTLLSDSALADLYRMRVLPSELDIPVMERVNEDPRELFARGLRQLNDACGDYAALLETPSRAFDGD